MPAVSASDLIRPDQAEPSTAVAERVARARDIQRRRGPFEIAVELGSLVLAGDDFAWPDPLSLDRLEKLLVTIGAECRATRHDRGGSRERKRHGSGQEHSFHG